MSKTTHPQQRSDLPNNLCEPIVESISEAVVITDANLEAPEPTIIYVNSASEQMTGYSRSEVLGSSPRILQGPATERSVLDRLREQLAIAQPFSGQTVNYRKDGSAFLMSWRVDPLVGDEGTVTHFMAVQRDVTEETSLRRRSEQLELLQRVNQVVATEGLDLDGVRQRVADVALDISGAEAAVVEEPEGSELVYRAVAGIAEGQVGLRMPIQESISGLCYSSWETLVCEDTFTDHRVPLKETARKVGFRSGVLIPLVHQGQCYGVLKVYSSRVARFDEDSRRLLELASGILASSLFDAASFDEEVKKRRLLVDAAPILIAYVDVERRFQEANVAHEQLFGKSVAEIRGGYLPTLFGQENYDRLRPYVDGALSGERVSFEVELTNGAGELRTYRGNLEPHVVGSGDVRGFYAAVEDITETRLAEIDYLTGLWNRRKFEELGAFVLEARHRDGVPVSFLMLDIDHFKQVNDTYGHRAGDEVLIQLAELLSDAIRKSDAACRWGGEEFAVLLYDSGMEDAAVFSDRLLESIRSHAFPRVASVTASLGIAEAVEGDSIYSLQERADAAMYQAKSAGRDRAARG